MEYDTKAIKCYHERALIQIRQWKKKHCKDNAQQSIYFLTKHSHTQTQSLCVSVSVASHDLIHSEIYVSSLEWSAFIGV